MASSLRVTTREHESKRGRSGRRLWRRVDGTSKAKNGTPRAVPLRKINFARSIGIKLRERGLEARRHQQILEVRVAAVDQEVDNFLVCLDGGGDLILCERARVVLVDHHEDLPRGEQEFGRKGLVLRGRGALAALALVGELLEALRQAPADRLLPCARSNP